MNRFLPFIIALALGISGASLIVFGYMLATHHASVKPASAPASAPLNMKRMTYLNEAGRI